MAQTVQPQFRMRNRSEVSRLAGFSLVEMLIVVVMIGIMAAFAWPRVVTVFNQSQVRSARLAVLNKFNQARINARQTSRHAYLIRSENVLWIERQPRVVPLALSTRDTVGGFLNLLKSYGVAAEGLTTLTIDPRGLTGLDAVIRLGRQGVWDSVVISGFGRVSR